MLFRKADAKDIPAVAGLYEKTHDLGEQGVVFTGWVRGVYPTEETARQALVRDDLFVLEEGGRVAGTGIINHRQMEGYELGRWHASLPPEEILVLHTLVIAPDCSGRGYGSAFVRWYEDLAGKSGCVSLRLDTNEINTRARRLYRQLGYEEVGIVPCTFQGIENVALVLLEKNLR